MHQPSAPPHDETTAAEPQPARHADLLREYAELPDREAALEQVRQLTEKILDETGTGLRLTQADLSGLDLSGMDLRHANLNRASLFGTRLAEADMSGCSLICAGIERTDFTDAVLAGAYVHSLAAQASKFVRADLRRMVDATGALFHGCDLTEANLSGAEIAGTSFYQCMFTSADLRGADLHGSLFNESRLDRADMSSTDLDGLTIVKCSMTGTTFTGARGQNVSILRPTTADGMTLSNATLPGLRLAQVSAEGFQASGLNTSRADVVDSDLTGADLSGTDLGEARFTDSRLGQATLENASLGGSTWTRVSAPGAVFDAARGESMTCTECTFTDARLIGFAGRYATFRSCDLRDANLAHAYLYRAVFVGDPPPSARMTGAVLDGANLTQAYLAADLTKASIRHAWATYARINQSVLAGADLQGTSLFRASAVKTDFTEARLGGQRGLLFADRCPGLEAALGAAEPGAKAVGALVADLTALLNSDSGKST